jgi:uncharacterized protein YjbI with pentapeptide repeats
VTARAERVALTTVLALVCALALAPAAGATSPFVPVKAALDRGHQRATITATVRWNVPGIQSRMVVGDVRAVAVDAQTSEPTLLDAEQTTLSESRATQEYKFVIFDRDKLAAMRAGNRIVFTATQHPVPSPTSPSSTPRSFVTVAELRAGPKRGRVGSADCSAKPIGTETLPFGLDFCDLEGAVLEGATLDAVPMHMVDLAGAVLVRAGLTATTLDGSRISGVNASQAVFAGTSLKAITAPRLVVEGTSVRGSNFLSAQLDRSSFAGSTLTDSPFTFAHIERATFSGATLFHEDLAYTRARGARFVGVTTTPTQRSTFFMSNLTDATLLHATINPDEAGETTQFSVLCRTVMPHGLLNNRDCPRRGS